MFVTTAELAKFLKQDDSASLESDLLNAEAMIAGFVLGDLNERTVSETHKPYYDLDADEPIVFRHGPVQQLASMSIDGTDTDTDDLIVTPWSVKNPDGFTKNTTIIFSLICGWDKNAALSASNRMPFRMREALKQIAAELVQRPQQNLISERIGDYSYTVDNGNGEFGLSPRAMAILEYWRPGTL